MSLTLLDHLGSLASILGLLIVVPTVIAAFYQSMKARQEAQQVRDGTLHSRDCLEFIAGDGSCINVVPLETLHSLPMEGDVLMLPGQGMGDGSEFLPGAYLVDSVEHIYAPPDRKLQRRRHEARLVAMLRDEIRGMNDVTLFGPEDSAGIVSFALDGIHPHDLGTILDEENVAIRAGHHCAQPLMDRLGVPATARASFGLYSDEGDVAALLRGIERTKRIFG